MSGFAQDKPIGSMSTPVLRTPMEKKATVGIDAGVNLSTFNVNAEEFANPSLAPNTNLKTSFHAGVFVEIPIGGNFFIKPEIYYSGQGSKMSVQQATGTGTTTFNFEEDLGYVYLAPAALTFRTPGGFMIETGPQIGYLVRAKVDGTAPSGYSNGGDLKGLRKKTDVLLSSGIGFMTRVGLGIHGRYNFGFSNVLNGDDNNNATGEMKTKVIQIGLAYHFGAHK